MPKNYFLVLILILSFASVSAFLTLTPNTKVVSSQSKESPSSTPDRDLSLYEQDMTYDFSLRKVKTLSAERQQFREFLWKQWSTRHRTKVTAKSYSSEGDPTISTYYIEPSENGNWHIVVESVSECCWYYAMRKPKKKVERRKFSATYSELERVQEIRNESGMFLGWKTIPTDKEIPPQCYMLRLRNPNEESSNVF